MLQKWKVNVNGGENQRLRKSPAGDFGDVRVVVVD